MRNLETAAPSLFERCFAAIFSGMAAGATYAAWMFFHTLTCGAEQVETFKNIGKWVVLAGAAVGFLGGISLVAWIWGEIRETSIQSLVSLRTAVVVLV